MAFVPVYNGNRSKHPPGVPHYVTAWQVDRFVPRVSPFEDEDDDEDEDEMRTNRQPLTANRQPRHVDRFI